MNVLVACEFSGRVRDAFRARGHNAWSCDLMPNDSLYHKQGNVITWLDYGWDLMIAHPPCTYLSSSGARWWKDRRIEQEDAIEFVYYLSEAPIPKICIENPIGRLSSVWRKPDQIIQPWQFGHEESKATCLWLKGLPLLVPTDIRERRDRNLTPSGQNKLGPSPDRWKLRSLTYEGIANAMAEQWG